MSYCENIKCDFCQKLFKNEELFMIEGKHLCQDCYNSNVVECEFCESDILIGNSHYFDVYSEQGEIEKYDTATIGEKLEVLGILEKEIQDRRFEESIETKFKRIYREDNK